ncbi:MAG: ion channel [Hyphomicrobiales bacterium]
MCGRGFALSRHGFGFRRHLYVHRRRTSPSAFSGFVVKDSATLADTMIYFSFGALTGIGSGDIMAQHPIARSVVLVEAMIGQLYPATLLARLVTLEIEDSRRV